MSRVRVTEQTPHRGKSLQCTNTPSLSCLILRSTQNGVATVSQVIDDLDTVLERFSSHKYQKAVMFVDNAGADVILGMLPFARELLKAGTKVILAANNGPSINDITAAELSPLIQSAAQVDDLIAEAWSRGKLKVINSGNDLPVVDLRQVCVLMGWNVCLKYCRYCCDG
eukprot:GHUV01024212.1.p1 GENE.GHUV01024212.1~~GHUV01024212.1.p1  ORF type:complete len:169 (+),score=29.76 GHUV01024212.1:1696-2202(+)